MKVETKLVLKNMKQNIKRTIFTAISIILCTILIYATILSIDSIKNGIEENLEKDYNDYHFIIRDIDIDMFNNIKGKEYIEKIYIQEDNDKQLIELKKPYMPSFNHIDNKFNIYIKYDNVKKVCDYSTDIIKTISDYKLEDKCEFNQKLLTLYGLVDVEIDNNTLLCRARINYSYIINILIIFTLVAFSILFIVILYNAFLITINERKKEYAILNSIGATEGQILKTIFLECFIIGIPSIIIGELTSFLATNIILKNLNNILINTGYNFRLIFDIKSLIFATCVIIINIYISAIIPSIKASTTSVIQGIRNNKQIKYKAKSKIFLKKFLNAEEKIAITNIKRNTGKYRIIIILLVVCMISYITVSTYINYEKATSELVNKYDVDAELRIDSTSNLDYNSILNNYEMEYKSKIDYTKYKKMGLFILVDPQTSIITNNLVESYKNNKKSMQMLIVGLDEKTYNNYINNLNAKNGDIIIYNNITEVIEKENLTNAYIYHQALKMDDKLKLSIITSKYDYQNDVSEYEIIDDKNLDGNFIITDKLIEGYKDLKLKFKTPVIFVNMDKYNRIQEKFDNYIPIHEDVVKQWIWSDSSTISIKVKCSNIIEFANYMENIIKKQNVNIDVEYYTLENQEKIIYINVVEFILNIIMIVIIIISIISTMNIINASLYERRQDFYILHSLGATKWNINKIMIYECIYMFIKATIISIVLSIPILYEIIKYMENILVLDKLLIPFGNICIYFTMLLLIFLIILLCSKKGMKEK